MKLYNTNEMPESFRIEKFNYIRDFTLCEHCGYESKTNGSVCIRYYNRYKKILCDRCVDNLDGITPWSNILANEHGLPEFHINAAAFNLNKIKS